MNTGVLLVEHLLNICSESLCVRLLNIGTVKIRTLWIIQMEYTAWTDAEYQEHLTYELRFEQTFLQIQYKIWQF